MATRKRIYYPETQIRNNIFTRGKEWMYIDDWSEYIGFYHRYTSTGEVYSEREWHPTKSKVLIPFKDKSPTYFRYINLVNYTTIQGQRTEVYGPIKLDRYSAPRAVIREPDPVELQSGMMNRFFLIKRNERATHRPIEIDKNQADTYDTYNHGINQYLYELVELPWMIRGVEFDIIDNGVIRTPGIVDTNRRIVYEFSKKFPILLTYVTNFRQFSIFNK